MISGEIEKKEKHCYGFTQEKIGGFIPRMRLVKKQIKLGKNRVKKWAWNGCARSNIIPDGDLRPSGYPHAETL